MNDTFDDYAVTDHAARYRSTAGTQEQVERSLVDGWMESIERDGYVIIHDVFARDTMARIRSEVEPLFAHDGGRNAFEGYRTRRLYSGLRHTFAIDPLVEHPYPLALLDRLLQPNYLLSQMQVIDITPGENAQALHPDDGFYGWPRPRPPLGAATIIAVDDFTDDNGATVVIPGSHTWGDRVPTADDEHRAVKAVMPSGSMLFFIATTWHGGGANTSDRPRMCVTAQYCEPWVRPQENYWLSMPRDRVAASTEHMQRLLGYSIHPPFIGMVEGMHPKRLLE